MHIGSRIDEIIEQKKMKKSSVAKAAGITPQQFCDMLHGRKVIKPEYINPLCNALGITPNDLFATDDQTA